MTGNTQEEASIESPRQYTVVHVALRPISSPPPGLWVGRLIVGVPGAYSVPTQNVMMPAQPHTA